MTADEQKIAFRLFTSYASTFALTTKNPEIGDMLARYLILAESLISAQRPEIGGHIEGECSLDEYGRLRVRFLGGRAGGPTLKGILTAIQDFLDMQHGPNHNISIRLNFPKGIEAKL